MNLNRGLSLALLALMAASLFGCIIRDWQVGQAVDQAIADFHAKAAQIRLGDSREKVLAILGPTQEPIPAGYRRPPETFMADNPAGGKDIVEIHYFRSDRIPDDIKTDDEFMPYVFRDGSLVAIGWTVLGGPKNFAKQPQPQTRVIQSLEPRRSINCYHTGNMTECH
jgi:hypothetical protein